ncbi:MAG: hypothetical protein L7V88_08440 [Alphaproteobacteria bacterium]|nr:hypothetical protein [Alphaproteobacteria bacterium]
MEYGFVDEEQMMKKLDPIFDNIKSLRTIASIEVLAANALSIDKTVLQKLDIDTPILEEMVAHLDSNLLVAHQLNQLKLLLKDAEIAALSEKLEEKNHPKSDLPKSDLNDPAREHVTPEHANPGHVNSLMNDIKIAVSTATTDINQNNAKSAQKTILHNINENVLLENTLSDETKQFIELTLNQIVREHLNTIVDDIMQGKKEKKSKVLDLSQASIPKKNQPNKK